METYEYVAEILADGHLSVPEKLKEKLGEMTKVKVMLLIGDEDGDGNLTCARRAGWLLEKAGFQKAVEKMAGWLEKKQPTPVKLDPGLGAKGASRDDRWGVLVNTIVEGDL